MFCIVRMCNFGVLKHTLKNKKMKKVFLRLQQIAKNRISNDCSISLSQSMETTYHISKNETSEQNKFKIVVQKGGNYEVIFKYECFRIEDVVLGFNFHCNNYLNNNK